MSPIKDAEGPRMSPITIPAEVRAQIYAHAIAVYPEECCGYLTGPARADSVDTAVRCRNAQPDGEHPLVPERSADAGFVIAGAELLAFARSFDSDHPARVVYHSHPNGQAYFSAVDRELAAGTYPVQHLVIGVREGGVAEVAQFAWSPHSNEHIEVARWTP
jgi:proteasome lid subunit RPN8/RPN11